MNNKLAYHIVLAALLLNAMFENSSSASRKFERALVIEGQNFNAAINIGIFDGLAAAGAKPDVVISSCGASIANGILHAFPNSKEHFAYLFSPDFHALLLDAKMVDDNVISLAAYVARRMAEMKIESEIRDSDEYGLEILQDKIPDFFHGYMFEVNGQFSKSLWQNTFNSNSTVRSVVLGSRLLFEPGDAGKPRRGKKLYQEVFFSDPEIIRQLKGFESPLFLGFPNSAVQRETDGFSNLTLGQAVRASVSDPFLMIPIQIPQLAEYQNYFAAGTIDLFPLEVAYQLADDVAMVYPTGFDMVETTAIQASFRYDMNERQRKVMQMYARWWIDYSNFEEIDKYIFKPANVDWMTVAPNIPNDPKRFQEMVTAQWWFGFKRGYEAAHQSANCKAHVRGVNEDNACEDLRDEIDRQTNKKIARQVSPEIPEWLPSQAASFIRQFK